MAPSLCQATGGMSLAFSAREGAPGVAVWWPRVLRGGCRDHSSLLGGMVRDGHSWLVLRGFSLCCPASRWAALGCVWVGVPAPEHPPGCHQLVPESVPIPWGQSCHCLSPPAQPHRGGLPRGDRRCCQRCSLLCHRPGARPWSCPLCQAQCVGPTRGCCGSVSVPHVCPHVFVPSCLSLRVCPHVFSPMSVSPCLSPVPVPPCLPRRVRLPVPVPVPVPACLSPRARPRSL